MAITLSTEQYYKHFFNKEYDVSGLDAMKGLPILPPDKIQIDESMAYVVDESLQKVLDAFKERSLGQTGCSSKVYGDALESDFTKSNVDRANQINGLDFQYNSDGTITVGVSFAALGSTMDYLKQYDEIRNQIQGLTERGYSEEIVSMLLDELDTAFANVPIGGLVGQFKAMGYDEATAESYSRRFSEGYIGARKHDSSTASVLIGKALLDDMGFRSNAVPTQYNLNTRPKDTESKSPADFKPEGSIYPDYEANRENMLYNNKHTLGMIVTLMKAGLTHVAVDLINKLFTEGSENPYKLPTMSEKTQTKLEDKEGTEDSENDENSSNITSALDPKMQELIPVDLFYYGNLDKPGVYFSSGGNPNEKGVAISFEPVDFMA